MYGKKKLTKIEYVLIAFLLIGMLCSAIGVIIIDRAVNAPQYTSLDELVEELKAEDTSLPGENVSDIETMEVISAEKYIAASPIINEVDNEHELQTSSKININTASLEQLQTLKGIGEKKAAAIIKERETVGPFKSIEDITRVKGIGDKIFESIKESIVN